ncbi:MAG: nickel-responsive transcriptional regulator NikR [Pseudomonadota bacterium]
MDSRLTRFSVSIETDLLTRFLRMAKKHGYQNRSEALRDVIREALVRDEWAGNDEIVGTITIVYDHHKRELTDRLTKIQHIHHDAVLASTHIHLDHDNCMEMIAIRGTASTVQKLADALISARGVMHGKLSATTTGKKLK